VKILFNRLYYSVGEERKMPKGKYQVIDNLAARCRPQTYEEVIGNLHVKRVLRGYLQTGPFPKSLMFIGPTGSGKTTLAELLARTVNCQSPKDDNSPCGECTSCKMPIGEDHPGIHLVDCTVKGLKGIKEITKISKLSPRFNLTVNILDEIQDAGLPVQKALLIPIEKSPPQTIWIFCTSEPHMILKALMGRCAQLNLKYPSAGEVSRRLQAIAESEFPTLAPILFPYLKKIAKICDCEPRASIERMDQIAMALIGSPKVFKDPALAKKILAKLVGDS
jgi:DNA polymerase-3 subunit gamma/tau